MRAIVCHSHDGWDGLRLDDVPAPVPHADEILIDMVAAGVSFANLLQIGGTHQNTPPLPFIPGTEMAGVVRACGPGVAGFQPGERVVAAARRGAFADQVVAPVGNVHRLPDDMSFAEAVHFPTIYATGFAALDWRAGLATDEILLVHGAAGASGLAAVEIGKALGATVIATASTAEKRAMAQHHGADHVLAYDGFRDHVLALSDGRGADVIFDPVGGDVFAQSLRCIAPEGRILPIGFTSGDVPQIPANIVLVKNITVIGIYWGYYTGWGRLPAKPGTAARVNAAMEQLFAWHGAGLLKPRTHAELPLEQVRDALEMVRSRQVIGKVVLSGAISG